jgi:V/A-type H+-transporting ATPase subunit I
MTKYSFILLNGEQEGLLEKLQEIGLVDITRSVKPVDGPSGELLRGVEQRKELVQSLGKIFFPETLQPAPVEGDLTYATAAALDTLEQLGEQMKALEKEAAAAEPWVAFDPELLRKLSDAGVPVQFHVSSAKSFDPLWV